MGYCVNLSLWNLGAKVVYLRLPEVGYVWLYLLAYVRFPEAPGWIMMDLWSYPLVL